MNARVSAASLAVCSRGERMVQGCECVCLDAKLSLLRLICDHRLVARPPVVSVSRPSHWHDGECDQSSPSVLLLRSSRHDRPVGQRRESV